MTRTLAFVSALFAANLFGQEITLEPAFSGIQNPVSITHAGDSRLFITEQRGAVRIYDGAQMLATPFLDIDPLVSCCGERGLLSVAFHPLYKENGFFYVNYTDNGGHTVVARYFVSADPNRADPNSARVVLTVNQPFTNHNGGQLQFGPDGYLYIGMGDGGSGGDPGNRAQNTNDLLGKMLRIDVDSANPYAVPPSNPFSASMTARHEIWSLGLRNPWRFSFDRVTGDLWIADVGQNQWEEVNFQAASSIGGENYGWNRMEGTHCYPPSTTTCNTNNLVLPVLEYSQTGGACSVTGGYVYRGARYPRLHGTYIYGDFCNGVIWGLSRNSAGAFVNRTLIDAPFSISTFGEDFNGELYVAQYSGSATIYRIIDPRPLPPKRRVVR